MNTHFGTLYSLLYYYVLLSSANYNEHGYIVNLNYGTDAELQLLIVLVYKSTL